MNANRLRKTQKFDELKQQNRNTSFRNMFKAKK